MCLSYEHKVGSLTVSVIWYPYWEVDKRFHESNTMSRELAIHFSYCNPYHSSNCCTRFWPWLLCSPFAEEKQGAGDPFISNVWHYTYCEPIILSWSHNEILTRECNPSAMLTVLERLLTCFLAWHSCPPPAFAVTSCSAWETALIAQLCQAQLEMSQICVAVCFCTVHPCLSYLWSKTSNNENMR